MAAAMAGVLSATGASAQTRRIAAASHSGAPTSRDADNFGLDMHIREQMRQRYDSVQRADSLQRADSARARVRVKQRRGE